MNEYPESALAEFIPEMERQMIDGRGFVAFHAFNQAMLDKYKKHPDISMKQLCADMIEWSRNYHQH